MHRVERGERKQKTHKPREGRESKRPIIQRRVTSHPHYSGLLSTIKARKNL
jgi:hypothetical protein